MNLSWFFDLDPIFDNYRSEPRIAVLRGRIEADVVRQRREIAAEEIEAGERPPIGGQP